MKKSENPNQIKIWEFICYPHEVCWCPQEQIVKVGNKTPFVESYIDDFTFKGKSLFGEGIKENHDTFDELCRDHDDCIAFVKSELKKKLDFFIDRLGFGQYAFNLHNMGENEKPHFHVIFIMPFDNHFCPHDVYSLLGMYKYAREDFTAYNKKFQLYKKIFPDATYPRYLIFDASYRSKRLRYLIHADNAEKYQYSPSLVVASFDYINDNDVSILKPPSDLGLFFSIIDNNHLTNEADYYRWLASADINPDVYLSLRKMQSVIHYIFSAMRR